MAALRFRTWMGVLTHRAGALPTILAFGILAAACGDDGEAGGSVLDAGTSACIEGECIQRPRAVCEGDQRVTFGFPGTCDPATDACVYPPARTPCEFGCEEGACLPNPCTGIVCTARRPAPRCEGDIALSFTGGACREGTCFYTESRLDCVSLGQVCAAGRCVETDPCEGVECIAPPMDCTDDGRSVRTYTAVGCRDGACQFTERREACPARQVCEDAACVADPRCEGIVCETPPPNYCRDGSAYNFDGDGACFAGACVYTPTRQPCFATGDLCENAACVPQPCGGEPCFDPPANACEGDVLVRWSPTGACIDNACVYTDARTDCAATGLRCVGQRCVDRCAGLTCAPPPAPACQGGVAVTYRAEVLCVDGECRYDRVEQDCNALDLLCRQGLCVGACDGVACDAVLADRCADPFTLLAGVFPGTCTPDGCVYAQREVRCAPGERCIDDACRPEVVCDEDLDCAPALDRCEGRLAVRPLATNRCQAGRCVFDETVETEDCLARDLFCEAGQCVAGDPCTGVVCDTPPANSCLGNQALQWSGGTCGGGACAYTSTLVDCGALALSCNSGRCEAVNPCTFTVCTATLPPFCEDNTAVQPTGPGTCEPDTGDCTVDIPGVRTPCGTEVCAVGTCWPEIPAGALAITEIFYQAGFLSGPEWVEIVNVHDAPVTLRSLSLRSAFYGQRLALQSNAVLAPGEVAVLAANSFGFASAPDALWDFGFRSFNLDDDELLLLHGDRVIDRVRWDREEGWPQWPGASIILQRFDDPAADNDDPTHWCIAEPFWDIAGLYQGTPGTLGGPCFTPPDAPPL